MPALKWFPGSLVPAHPAVVLRSCSEEKEFSTCGPQALLGDAEKWAPGPESTAAPGGCSSGGTGPAHAEASVEHEPGGRQFAVEVPVPAGQWEIDLERKDQVRHRIRCPGP